MVKYFELVKILPKKCNIFHMKIFIGFNIRYLCKVKKLSQKDFGSLFGLTYSNVSSYVNERAFPNFDVIIKICDYFGLTLDDFVRKPINSQQLSQAGMMNRVEEPVSEYVKPSVYEDLLSEKERTIRTMEETLSVYREMFERSK